MPVAAAPVSTHAGTILVLRSSDPHRRKDEVDGCTISRTKAECVGKDVGFPLYNIINKSENAMERGIEEALKEGLIE